MSEEQPQPSERPKEVELEPLKPLEPDLVTAMTRLMEGTLWKVQAPHLRLKPQPFHIDAEWPLYLIRHALTDWQDSA